MLPQCNTRMLMHPFRTADIVWRRTSTDDAKTLLGPLQAKRITGSWVGAAYTMTPSSLDGVLRLGFSSVRMFGAAAMRRSWSRPALILRIVF